MLDSKSIILYESSDYTVRVEYNDSLVLLHLPEVFNFNKTVLKKMQDKVVDLLDFFYDFGYNCIWAGCPSSNSQIRKLIDLLGFSYVKDHDGLSFYNLGLK